MDNIPLVFALIQWSILTWSPKYYSCSCINLSTVCPHLRVIIRRSSLYVIYSSTRLCLVLIAHHMSYLFICLVWSSLGLQRFSLGNQWAVCSRCTSECGCFSTSFTPSIINASTSLIFLQDFNCHETSVWTQLPSDWLNWNKAVVENHQDGGSVISRWK